MIFLALIPIGILTAIATKAINYSVDGGSKRLVGIITCLLFGGGIAAFGYWAVFIGYETHEGSWQEGWTVYQNTNPIVGGIALLIGGSMATLGTLWSAMMKEKWDVDMDDTDDS